jgi:hypothetical protein
MKALLPNQPITRDGHLPSPQLLEALQLSQRDMGKSLDGKAPLIHSHTAAEISDATTAGRAMLTAADVAAQTALLNTFTATDKGLVPASGGGLAVLRADGAWRLPSEYGHLAADYTLTSTTAVQRLFNWSANGALTLQTGVYRFRAMIYLTGMDAASGNAAFHLLGAGTAVLARVLYDVSGLDSATPLAAAARAGSASVTQDSAASMVSAATGTGLVAVIDGAFDVTTAGTVVPSIALVTAAAAAVKAGSFFEVRRVGNTGAAASAGWG